MPDAEAGLMTIFAEALERTDPAARAAYLDGACGDDAGLRRRVEALLAAHDGAGRFLEGDPTGMSEPTSPETPDTTCASVSETRLPSELATRGYRSDGTISTFAGGQLFVSVCQAVQHAHQKGIIHRDLKPSNVLVTELDGRPTPKVIDFGVAKATGFKLTDQSLADTGAIVGTPTYMSPEQADPSSMDIDTRTDVYALGVILYELLAGSPPLGPKQFKRGAILEMLRMVREVDPPRPSTKVSTAEGLPGIAACRDIEPAQLKRALQGDLDWIVMKSLEKDRTRRYETANGFAADILRHLAYEPVLAAPPSRAYRLRKVVRRHRGAVIAASLVLVALLAGIAGTTVGLIRAENRRVEADRARADEAERVTERDEALKNEAERVKERDVAIKTANDRADELKYRLGVSNVLLASSAYDNRDVVLAAERLDDVPPDQRGWEWRYLKQQTRGGLFNLYGHTGGVSSVSFSSDGTRIVTGSLDGTAKVWDARTGTVLLELKGHTSVVSSVSFSPDGTRIVTGSEDNTAKMWDARTGTALLELRGHRARLSGVSFSPDGARIVTGSLDGTAKVWDARTGTSLLDLKGHTNAVSSVSFSSDGTWIVTGSADNTAKVWDARTGTVLHELKGHTSSVWSVSFSSDGTRIVTGSLDGTAKVWDARTGMALLELKGHTGGVSRVSFSPDGTRIVTGSEDKTAKVWDARIGTALLDLKGHRDRVLGVSFSPDGTRIVSGSEDKTAKVWDARTGMALLELKGHTGGVSRVSFSPDGTRIVTGSEDKTAKVWDAGTGTALLELKGHASGVRSVWFSPDGTRIVTGSEDLTAKVWDARTGREVKGEPIPHAPRPGQVSPDGRWIAHVAGDRVELIPLQPDAEELEYRRIHTLPNFGRYLDGYDAASKAEDQFAARFYLNLLPPPVWTRHLAEAIVAPLFARLLLRDDVLAALKAQPAADPEVQAACLELAGAWTESGSPLQYNSVSWSLVREPGQPDAMYQRGLRLAEAACRLEPDNGFYLNTLGVARYRSGLVVEALATLTRSNDLNEQKEPADLAFLALAQSRLGQSEKARSNLGRLRELMKNPPRSKDKEAQALLREAETVELDLAFPADPFAR